MDVLLLWVGVVLQAIGWVLSWHFEKGGISSREYIQTLKDRLLVFLQDLNGPEEPLGSARISHGSEAMAMYNEYSRRWYSELLVLLLLLIENYE